MAMAQDVRQTIKTRLQNDYSFRFALLSEAMEGLLGGDVETAKRVLWDYIDATIGFAELAVRSGLPVRSLRRMFTPQGDPRASEMFKVIAALQKHQGVQLEVGVAA